VSLIFGVEVNLGLLLKVCSLGLGLELTDRGVVRPVLVFRFVLEVLSPQVNSRSEHVARNLLAKPLKVTMILLTDTTTAACVSI